MGFLLYNNPLPLPHLCLICDDGADLIDPPDYYYLTFSSGGKRTKGSGFQTVSALYRVNFLSRVLYNRKNSKKKKRI